MAKKDILEAKNVILSALRERKVSHVEVEYSGSGDSGDVQGAMFFGAAGEARPDAGCFPVIAKSVVSEYDTVNGCYVERVVENQSTLKEACSDFASDFLSYLGIDWYNNEGGYGTITINVESGKVKASHEMRVEHTEHSDHSL